MTRVVAVPHRLRRRPHAVVPPGTGNEPDAAERVQAAPRGARMARRGGVRSWAALSWKGSVCVAGVVVSMEAL